MRWKKHLLQDITALMTDKDENSSAETQDKSAEKNSDRQDAGKEKSSGGWLVWLLLIVIAAGAAIYNLNPDLFSLKNIKSLIATSTSTTTTPQDKKNETEKTVIEETTAEETTEGEIAKNTIATEHEAENSADNKASADDIADIADIEARLTQIESSLDELHKRVATLEENVKTATSEYGPFVSSGEEVEALQDRLQALENDTSLTDDIATLKSAISDLSKRDNSPDNLAAIRLLLAFDRLENAIDSGLPYMEELSEVSTLLSGKPQSADIISELKVYAISGVPSKRQLKDEISTIAKEATLALQQRDNSVSGKILGALSTVISVRKIDGNTEGTNNPELRIAHIETLVQHDKFKDALAELRKIDDPVIRDKFSAWQKKAEFVANIPVLLTELRELVHSIALNPVKSTTTSQISHAP